MSKHYEKSTLSLSRNRPLNSKFKKQKSGFTLLEILLVVGIISILAGIVIVAINPSKQLATVRNTERKSDIKQIDSAITQYYIDNFKYPPSLTGVSSLKEICDTGALSTTTGSSIDCTDLVDLTSLVPMYLTAIPRDPSATTTDHAGYQVVLASNKIGLSAPAELNQTITIGTVAAAPEEEVDACGTPGDATDPDCWSDEETGLAWGPTGLNVSGVSESTTAEDGKANTAALYALGATYAAAYHCYTLDETINGAVPPDGTWYLPSYKELWDGYNAPAMSGGFPSAFYWSSTEDSGNPDHYAWYLYTPAPDGGMYNFNKYYQHSVRCLR